MALSEKVPHDDFREGFIVGWQTVKGRYAAIPGIPGQPGTPGGMTAFLMGVRKGIARALDRDWDDLAG